MGEALKSTCEVWMDDAWLVSNHTSITYYLYEGARMRFVAHHHLAPGR